MSAPLQSLADAVVILTASESPHQATALLGSQPHLRLIREPVTTENSFVRRSPSDHPCSDETRLVDSSWMTEMAAMNGLQATPASIRPWRFFPGSWDTTTCKGTSYGVPFTADTSVIYYRTDTAKAGIHGAPADDWTG
ncbi:hypothetical protein [Streptomyces sp. ME19-01-6]|uniref:hypothetical protein n=1 Tax=Streptomyces sp. ME19-01-6 TaxID=3028686 RepID=UPI0029A6C76C|nr:hypothetical protein [Streptomyces sp. ME19-01-6]MDX3224618.1 hypothetical protein [Streptomyces sp. ME19-01-6]